VSELRLKRSSDKRYGISKGLWS